MLSNHNKFILFSFDNINEVINALDSVKCIEGSRIIPLPPEIDEGCGMILRIKEEYFLIAKSILNNSYIKTYLLKYKNGKRVIEEYVF